MNAKIQNKSETDSFSTFFLVIPIFKAGYRYHTSEKTRASHFRKYWKVTHDVLMCSLNYKREEFLLGNILFAVRDNDALVILRHTLSSKVVGDSRNRFDRLYAVDAVWVNVWFWIATKNLHDEVL